MIVGLLCAIFAILVANSITWKDTELEDLGNCSRGERLFWGTAKTMLPIAIVVAVIGFIALFAYVI